MLETTAGRLTTEQAEKIACLRSRFEGNRITGKTAIVAPAAFLERLSRVFAMQSNLMAAPHTSMVFSSRDTAEKWLDAP